MNPGANSAFEPKNIVDAFIEAICALARIRMQAVVWHACAFAQGGSLGPALRQGPPSRVPRRFRAHSCSAAPNRGWARKARMKSRSLRPAFARARSTRARRSL